MMKIDSQERLVREIADAMQSHTNEFDNRWFLNLTEQKVGIRVDPDYCDPDCLWPNEGDARFKAAADVLDLLQDWYAYQNNWYMEKAEEWMQENGVCFEDGKVVCKGSTMTWFDDREDDDEEA